MATGLSGIDAVRLNMKSRPICGLSLPNDDLTEAYAASKAADERSTKERQSRRRFRARTAGRETGQTHTGRRQRCV